jgi:hypothetical protein
MESGPQVAPGYMGIISLSLCFILALALPITSNQRNVCADASQKMELKSKKAPRCNNLATKSLLRLNARAFMIATKIFNYSLPSKCHQ